jgi:2-methylcitrate dehydratase PrpD
MINTRAVRELSTPKTRKEEHMETAAEQFAAFTSSLGIADIPDDVVQAAKLHVLDTLGCGLAAHSLDAAPAARAAMVETGVSGPASVIGVRDGLPAADAALVNGVTCHALDYDDTHTASIAHVSVAVVPAALAVAQSEGASGADALAAVIAGNEVVTRLGMAVGSAFHARGFHPTAVCGVFGATSAAARLGGLDAATTVNALGIAGSMASGLLEYLADGSSTKRLHPGWAAHGGIIASRLAAHGATGPSSVIEGRFGLYRAFVERGDVDIAAQTADLGRRWETPEIAFKPYPACHFMHASLDATAQMGAEAPIDLAEIEEIVALTPQAGVSMVLEPLADKHRPRSAYEAKFSLPYSVASLLIRGKVDLSTYSDEAIREEEVLKLAAKVGYEVKDYETFPRALPGGVRVRMRDARTLEAELPYQRGGPDNPMTADEVREKFRANASLALEPDDVEALEDGVMTLESHGTLEFLEALSRAVLARGVAA